MKHSFVYLIVCHGQQHTYVKIGKTVNMYLRLSNIQTGCPHAISHAFVISSQYEEEVLGLEKLLHRLLKCYQLRGEWYEGSHNFFEALISVFKKINGGLFTYEEIEELPEFGVLPELEIMLHRHNFNFQQVCLPLRKSTPTLTASKQITIKQIGELLLHDRDSVPA